MQQNVVGWLGATDPVGWPPDGDAAHVAGCKVGMLTSLKPPAGMTADENDVAAHPLGTRNGIDEGIGTSHDGIVYGRPSPPMHSGDDVTVQVQGSQPRVSVRPS